MQGTKRHYRARVRSIGIMTVFNRIMHAVGRYEIFVGCFGIFSLLPHKLQEPQSTVTDCGNV